MSKKPDSKRRDERRNSDGTIDLAGRKALVTGGARGIGATVAAALGKAGTAVMVGDIPQDVGRETVARCDRGGPAGKGGAIVNIASVAAIIAFRRSPAIPAPSRRSTA